MQLKLPFSMKKREKWYLAGCDQMDIFSQGETEEIALENLKEAIRLFMASCLERNTLNQVLEDCGFHTVGDPLSECEKKLAKEGQFIEIPLPIMLAVKGEPDCRA